MYFYVDPGDDAIAKAFKKCGALMMAGSLKEVAIVVPQLPNLRAAQRQPVDDLLRALLSCTAPRRVDMLRETPPTITALALDRVQCGTAVLLDLERQGIVFPPRPEGLSERDFFLMLLTQDFRS
jgi:hypothetical protein